MSAGTEESQRLAAPDVLKGVIMMLIVFAHILFLVPSTGGSGRDQPLAVQVIYLGLMFFFILSGYFYRPGRSPGSNISKRAVQLLIPTVLGLLVLPTVLFVYLYVLGQGPVLDDLLNNYLRVFGSAHMFEPLYDPSPHEYGIMVVYNGYYFLQIMLVSFIIFYAVIDRVREDLARTVCTIVALVALQVVLLATVDIVLPLWLNLVPISAAFMFLGQLMSRYKLIEWVETCPVGDRSFWISIPVSAIILMALCMVSPPGTGFDHYSFGEYGAVSVFPYFVEAVIASYLYLVLAGFIARVPVVSKVLIAVGRHTVAVLCLHIFMIKVLISPFYQLVPSSVFPKLPTTEAILVGITAITMIVVMAEYISRYLSGRFSNKH